MLSLRFTQKEGCDIHGTPAELRAISEKIQQIAAAGRGSHSFPADTSISPDPYDRALSRLIVRATTGPVCATVDGDTLTVEAGKDFLVGFASFFNFSEHTPHGAHYHHDYWEGNEDVSPKSVALVIGV